MKRKVYIAILIFILLIFIMIEFTRPRQVSWMNSFSERHSIPYGCLVLRNTLEDVFSDTIINRNSSLYETLKGSVARDENYILINSNVELDKESSQRLIKWVRRGNNAFIASHSFYGTYLRDTLGVSMAFQSEFFNEFINKKDSAEFHLNFTNSNLRSQEGYKFNKQPVSWYFSGYDTLRTSVLGTIDEEYTNFIRIKAGDGNLYLCSTPYVFTNYSILDNDGDVYAYKALSYMPKNNKTYWDEHYKDAPKMASTPLRYILSVIPLRWAYYTAIVTIILYIVISAKRKQRAIPVIEPPRNSTLDFVDTISNLYLHKSDHANIAGKKITYFLDYIRERFNLETNKTDTEFFRALAGKSGIEARKIAGLFARIEDISNSPNVSKQQLLELNKEIEEFYEKADHGRKYAGDKFRRN